MAGFRYRVLYLPVKGAGAFAPIPATNPAASSWGLVHVTGAPGTIPVASPKPAALPDLTAAGAPNTAQGSDVAPNVIAPAIYVASVANMGPEADTGLGLAVRRRNPLPVPAVDPTRIPVVAMSAPRVGGRGALPWPRSFQRYPNQG